MLKVAVKHHFDLLRKLYSWERALKHTGRWRHGRTAKLLRSIRVCVCVLMWRKGTVPAGFGRHRGLFSIRSALPSSLSPTLRNSLSSALKGHVLRSGTVGANPRDVRQVRASSTWGRCDLLKMETPVQPLVADIGNPVREAGFVGFDAPERGGSMCRGRTG